MDPGPAHKRRRPAVACTECRRRKIRCNRVRPCGPCSSRSWPAMRCVYNNGHNDNDNNNSNSNSSPINSGYLDDRMEHGGHGQIGHCQSIRGLSSEVPDPEKHAQDLGLFPFHMTPLHQDDVEAGFIDIDQDWDDFGLDCSHVKRRSGDLSTTNPSYYGKSPTWTSFGSRSVGTSSFIESEQHQKLSLSWDSASASGSGSGPDSELQDVVEPSGSECENHWYDVFARCKKLRFLIHGISHYPLPDSSAPLQPEQKSVQPLMEAFARLERAIQHERECKALNKTSSWPIAVSSTPCIARDLLPPHPICDVLLNAYIKTFESVLRILHVPSFLHDYERFWAGSTLRPEDPDEPFECKLIVAIAIGSCTCVNLDISFREQASGWIAYGQQWLTWKMAQGSCPDLDKAQIVCLLALARHTHRHDDAISTDAAWLPGGNDLTRMAVQMGLHREPRISSPGMSAMSAEIRRRLWATMLELSLQLCFDQGLPAPLTPESYDCEAPSNIPDEDIAFGPEPSDCAVKFTSSTLLVLLSRTQRLRLQILHLVNTPGASKTYDDGYQLAAEMNDACCADLDMLRFMSVPKPTNFQIKLLDMFTRPFVLALHGPFADQATGKPAYYYSRRTRLEVSTSMLTYPPQPVSTSAKDLVSDLDLTETISQPNTTTSTSKPTTAGTRATEQDAYTALRIHGRGHFALVQRQATAALCMDLIGELEDNAFPTLDGASRQQLRDVLRSAVGVFKRQVRASGGAHSAREFLFFSCADAYIGAMIQQGHNKSRSLDVDWAISRAARTALAMCCEVMETPRRHACACGCVIIMI